MFHAEIGVIKLVIK